MSDLNEPAVRLVIDLAGTIVAVVCATATLAWWLSRQFQFNRETFYRALAEFSNRVEAKISDHEKEDNSRFREIERRLWYIQVRNARIDNEPEPDNRPNGA
jgi:hypothetical protein